MSYNRYQNKETQTPKRPHTWQQWLMHLSIRGSALIVLSFTSTFCFVVFGKGGLLQWLGLIIEVGVSFAGWHAAKTCKARDQQLGYYTSYGLICSVIGYLIRMLQWTLFANMFFYGSFILLTGLIVSLVLKYRAQIQIRIDENNMATEEHEDSVWKKYIVISWAFIITVWAEKTWPYLQKIWPQVQQIPVVYHIIWLINDPGPAWEDIKRLWASWLDKLANRLDPPQSSKKPLPTQNEDETY